MAYNPALLPMRHGLWLAVTLALLVVPRAGAQVLTGELIVNARDIHGAVVAGALVSASSASLIGGPKQQATDWKGQALFRSLPPGTYAIDVQLANFTSQPKDALDVRAARRLDVSVVLEPAGGQMAVTVTGSSIDARDPGFSTIYDHDFIEGIPTLRNGVFAFIGAAAGVSPTSLKAAPFVSVFGSGVDQNASIVDGMNVTATSNGIMRAEPGIDFVQNITIQTIGASAEYGHAQGGVFNIITRQGGNRLLWDLSYYGQPAFLTSQPFKEPINFFRPEDLRYDGESGYERLRYHDATTTLGGPVIRDRVWFFAGYQYLRDVDSQPGADSKYPKEYKQDKALGKLTWRLGTGWRLEQSVHYEAWDNLELPTATKRPEATQRLRASVPAVNLGHLTHVSPANRVWDISVGLFKYSQDIDPRISSDKPGFWDRQSDVMTGAPMQIGQIGQTRWTTKATLSLGQRSFFGAGHDLKVGGQFDRGDHRSLQVVPTGKRYETNAPPPVRFLERESPPSNAGGLFVAASGFVTDAVAVGNRLTISAGARFDHYRAISPNLYELNAARAKTGVVILGEGLLYTWNVVSPRTGMALKLTADGRTILRASYGRYRQGVLTGEISPDHPGVAKVTTRGCDPRLIEGVINCPGDGTVVDPRSQVFIDTDTRAPVTDAYSIGFDREVARTLSASVVYVHKNGRDFIGWEDLCPCYDTVTQEVADSQQLELQQLKPNQASQRKFWLGNRENYSLAYHGVAMVVEKRQSRGWQAQASYTWSRAMGLQPSSGTTASGAQVATTGAPPVSFAAPLTFGRDPNTLINAYGRLPNDRPHLFRVMGIVDVPGTGVAIAANLQHFSGKPWAATDLVFTPPQGPVRILLESRGSRRLSSQTLLDLRVSRPFTLGDVGRVELRADVLNLLNETAEEAIGSDNYAQLQKDGGPQGTVFVDPRRVMLSVKLSFGR